MVPHGTIYEQAALYDLAFSYRDFAVESAFLRSIYERRRGRSPRSFLELAAGPARHSLEMVSAGLDVMALDLAPDMATYARRKAQERGVALPYTVADMTAFAPPGAFDLAACLLCSASYLLTDQAVLSHFGSVRASLVGDGMYVLELTHPSELVGPRKTNSTWTMRDEHGELHVDWRGDPGDAIDGIWPADVRLAYRPFDGSAPFCAEDRAFQRGFTHAQIVELAEQTGFSVEATLGAFDENVELDSPTAKRMVLILKRSSTMPALRSRAAQGAT